MPGNAPKALPRRTQAERSACTRARFIDATIGCLIDHGYAGTSTLALCRRARVSNGSLLHHYGSRERLLGAALEAVYARLRDGVVRQLEALPAGDQRTDALVDVLWTAFGARLPDDGLGSREMAGAATRSAGGAEEGPS